MFYYIFYFYCQFNRTSLISQALEQIQLSLQCLFTTLIYQDPATSIKRTDMVSRNPKHRACAEHLLTRDWEEANCKASEKECSSFKHLHLCILESELITLFGPLYFNRLSVFYSTILRLQKPHIFSLYLEHSHTTLNSILRFYSQIIKCYEL